MAKLIPSCVAAKWIIENRACNGGRLTFLKNLGARAPFSSGPCPHFGTSMSEMHILQNASKWSEAELWKIAPDNFPDPYLRQSPYDYKKSSAITKAFQALSGRTLEDER